MLRDRLLARAPERIRPLLKRLFAVLVVAFLLFELWRFVAVVPMLRPAWDVIEANYLSMAAASPAVAIVSLTVTALAFAIPFGGFLWLLRRLFHHGTVRR